MKLEFHQLERRLEHLRVRRPDRQRRLMASLAVSGQQVPIVVVAVEGQPDRYLVIDGHKRIAGLEQLGRDTVEATVWEMSEAEALVLERSMRFSEAETALEQGWLLAELEQRFGYTLQDLARRFDRSTSWVSRRLALVELLSESVQQKVREGAISAHIAMKYLAPVARVSLAECERMATGFAARQFTTRQAGQIYAAWRDAGPGVRRRILEEPELFLKAQDAAGQAPSNAPPPMELMRDLEMVLAISRRAGRRFARAGPLMDREQLEAARHQIERAREELEHLEERIGKEENHVEHAAAVRDSGTTRPGNPEKADCPDAEDLHQDRKEDSAVAILPTARCDPSREGRTLPPADSRAVGHLQRELGPGS